MHIAYFQKYTACIKNCYLGHGGVNIVNMGSVNYNGTRAVPVLARGYNYVTNIFHCRIYQTLRRRHHEDFLVVDLGIMNNSELVRKMHGIDDLFENSKKNNR